MIDINELNDSCIGKKIVYKPVFAIDNSDLWEYGFLSSYNKDTGAIFVRFKSPNGERCNPQEIYFVTDSE
jgi:hypothetical protein